MKTARELIAQLGLINPSQWKNPSGKIWRKLIEIELIRHRLSHGFDSLDPKLIRISCAFVSAALHNRIWLENVKSACVDGRPLLIGSIMSRQTKRPFNLLRERNELLGLFDKTFTENSDFEKMKLPSIYSIENTLLLV